MLPTEKPPAPRDESPPTTASRHAITGARTLKQSPLRSGIEFSRPTPVSVAAELAWRLLRKTGKPCRGWGLAPRDLRIPPRTPAAEIDAPPGPTARPPPPPETAPPQDRD